MPPMMKTIADACGIGTATTASRGTLRLALLARARPRREHRRYIAIPDPSPEPTNGATKTA